MNPATRSMKIVTGVLFLIGTFAPIASADDIDTLLNKLRDSDETVAETAEQALIQMGSAAVDPIARLLKGEERGMQSAAVRILGKIGTPASEALIATLKTSQWRARMGAARALGTIKGPTALNPLLDALRDDHQGVRATAASALGDLGDAHAMQALIKTLKDEKPAVRAAAARGLGKLGDAGAVDPLLEAIQEPGRVQRATVKALAKIGTPAVNSMGKVLTNQNGDPGVRAAIAKAFEQMRAEASVGALSAALQDKAYKVRRAAADALIIIGPPTVSSVRKVLVQNPDSGSRTLAAEILTEASRQANRPWAQDALAGLIVGLKDDDPNVRAAANTGIDRFRFQALEQLYVGLRDSDTQFRVEIINILADILHPLSIRHLEELLKTEKDPEVRKIAETAIHRIKEADTLTPN